MKPGWYTATAHGVDWIGFLDARGVYWTLGHGFNESDLTNLQPAKVVNADAVVIEGVTAEEFEHFIRTALGIKTNSTYNGVAVAQATGVKLLAQLSTPAEPEEGCVKCNMPGRHCSCGDAEPATDGRDWPECPWNVGSGILCGTLIKDETSEFCHVHAKERYDQMVAEGLQYQIDNPTAPLRKIHVPQSPKGVWIELTEYDKINVETAMKTIQLPVPLAEIIAKIYHEITPKGSEESPFSGEVKTDYSKEVKP